MIFTIIFSGFFFISCSQIRMTFQPRLRSFARFRRSRRELFSIFGSQYFLLLLGRIQCCLHPCQKQPSTNTASFLFGKIKSGEPSTPLTCLRQPAILFFLKHFMNSISVVLLSVLRIAVMFLLRCSFETLSIVIHRLGLAAPPFQLFHFLHFQLRNLHKTRCEKNLYRNVRRQFYRLLLYPSRSPQASHK